MSGSTQEVSEHELAALRGELGPLAEREAAELSLEEAEALGEGLLEEVNARLSADNKLVRHIAARWTEFINCFATTRQEYEAHLTQLNEELEERTGHCENLQEEAAHLEQKLHRYEEECDRVKTDLIHLSERHERLEADSLLLRAQLTRAQTELQATLEAQRHHLSTAHSQKEILLDQVRTERKANQELGEEVAQLAGRVGQQERELRAQAARLQETLKYSREMENILNEKNETIARLEADLEARTRAQPEQHPAAYFAADHQDHLDPQIQEAAPLKLEDELPFYEFHRRLSEMGPVRLVQLEEEPVPLRLNLDPYFSHFVLTSQSVKIREDCEELLNIDAKPFYAEIVEKRVPMHLWDQWIRNKLREELRLRGTPHSDQDD